MADEDVNQGAEVAETAATETAATETAVQVLPDDPLRRPLLDRLAQALGDDLVGFELAGDDLWIRVRPEAWRRTAQICKERLNLDYFCFLSGLDWLQNPGLSGEKVWDPGETEPQAERPGDTYTTGVAGGRTRFQVFARLYDVRTNVGVTIKADLDSTDPRVESIVPVFRGADWHERETWEMYGFDFIGHPGLRHLYLPSEFEGFPLRKDFPLLARLVKPWPGLVDVEPMPGDEADGEAGDGASEEG